MVGVLLGSYVFGEASDRFGRKPTFIASVVIQTVFGLLAGLLPGTLNKKNRKYLPASKNKLGSKIQLQLQIISEIVRQL